MPDSADDILQFLQEQQDNQNPDQSLEQMLIEKLLNPEEKTVKRLRLIEDPNSPIVTQVREEIVVNQEGFPEKIEEETINVSTLDDGTPMNTYGICRCQSCHKLVSAENLSRCLCGKTSCVMCGRFDVKRRIWYCSFWHKLLGKIYGFLGFGFR